MKKCRVCELELEVSSFEKGRGTCRKCRAELRKIHPITCKNCEKVFKSANKSARFCGSKCVGESRKRHAIVTCSYCGSDKKVVPSLLERINDHYCNQNCRTEHMKITMVGGDNPNYNRVQKPCDGCGELIQVRPYELQNLNNNFCSYSCYVKNIGRFYSGENNSNWNGSLTTEERLELRRYPEYYSWRKEVYDRDTCQCCGSSKSGTLNAHHIENYKSNVKKRTCLDNGITLCNSCHLRFHQTYGFFNNNKEQLIEYITEHKDALA